jgi:4-amino-4-deoxy-L-arabinose transferase-like glycosyltransferase
MLFCVSGGGGGGAVKGLDASRAGRVAVLGIVAIFAVLSSVVAVTTPAWEAADEPDHVQNIETLVSGHWYRMERGAGYAAHQPPLYYLGVSAWQRLWGVPVRQPGFPPPRPWVFKHRTARDSADHRFVLSLRLSSVLLGASTVLFAAVTARRLSSDPWTPAVAAAVVAGVPTFVFLSGVVNNDNLANALGGLLTLLAVVFVVRSSDAGSRARLWWAAAVGAVFGLLVLTKLSTVALAGGVMVAVLIGVRSWRERVKTLCVAAASTLTVCGWWLVQNQIRYGDPLAARRTHDYLESIGGLGGHIVNGRLALGPGDRNPLKLFLFDVPRNVYHSFWYNSGWNKFRWPSSAYIVFWAVLLIAIAGLVITRGKLPPTITRPVLLLAILAVSALAAVWITASQTTTFQARLAFTGLPAIGCLAALGLERSRVPIPLRFVGPVIGLVGTLIAIRQDILSVNWR